MSEPNEHDEGEEAVSEPVAPGTVSDEEAAEDEANDAETGAGDAGDGESGALEHVHLPGDEQERQASAREQRDQQKAVEKMFDSFQREAERHTKRIAEIAGDSAPDLLQCVLCAPEEGQPNMPGWLLPVKPSEDKIAAIRQAIGLAPKIDYREDPHSKVCPTCGGLKSVLPAGGDSTTPLLPCADCQSQGWIATDSVRGGAPTNGEVRLASSTDASQPVTLEHDPPEVAALKAAGYTVIEPFRATA